MISEDISDLEIKKSIVMIIGNEILSGMTQDTNSSFIAKNLKNIGVEVLKFITISDDKEIIKQTLSWALTQADIVFMTGGLGPTEDDFTTRALAEFFHSELEFRSEVFQQVERYLLRKNRADLVEINRPQAFVLPMAQIIENHNGTAPVQMIEIPDSGKMIFSLPGVPTEVKPLVKNQIIPLLKQKINPYYILNKIISVAGIPESLLSEIIEHWQESLPKEVALSYLPEPGRVKLSFTLKGKNQEQMNDLLDNEIEKLKEIIGENIIAENGDKIQEILKEILIQRNLTLSVAESCTLGALSHLIGSVSGSSAYFLGGVCTYQTEKKVKILKVKKDAIRKHSVVSELVAQQMSLGCQKLFQTDIALSTTGVAGPEPDESNNPLGLAYYSIRIGEMEQTFKIEVSHLEREDFIQYLSYRVLLSLVEILQNHQFHKEKIPTLF